MLNRLANLSRKRAKTSTELNVADGGKGISTTEEPGQFQLEVGEMEKRMLEGKLLYPSDMILKVSGEDVRNRFQSSREVGIEVFEGEIGETEKMSVRIERETNIAFRSKVRVTVNGRLAQVFHIQPRWKSRNLFFQGSLSCLFLVLASYYIFISRPEVASFYTGIFSRPQTQLQQREQSKPRGMPVQPGKEKRMESSMRVA